MKRWTKAEKCDAVAVQKSTITSFRQTAHRSLRMPGLVMNGVPSDKAFMDVVGLPADCRKDRKRFILQDSNLTKTIAV